MAIARQGEAGDGTPGAASPREGGGGPSLPGRLIGGGAGAAKRVAGATGLDRTVESVVEEAIVRAFESAPVERAVERIIDGPATERAIAAALDSPAVAQAVERSLSSEVLEQAVRNALDSQLVDRVWEQVLDSDEVQKLIKRIAEAPEVRSAISSQGVSFVEDIFRRVRDGSAKLDLVVERIVRRITFQKLRPAPSDRPGLITRALGLGLDLLVLQGIFLVGASVFGWIRTSILGASGGLGPVEFWIGAALTLAGVITYFLTFWSIAGQTIGMRLLGLRVEIDQSPYIGFRRSVKRLVGFVIAVVPFGLGLLRVLFADDRRGLHDVIAGTYVDYIDPDFSLRLLTPEEDDEYHQAKARREGRSIEEVKADEKDASSDTSSPAPGESAGPSPASGSGGSAASTPDGESSSSGPDPRVFGR
ncbi:RDD family protein [Thermoleophilia bacterium SCSIO 60948]|nr:RDD family protein [Thermoleophilia bacterium SCSIO 60948]